jgi:hypothetical protein
LGRHKKPILPPIIVLTISSTTKGKDVDELGPGETWVTYQEQLQAEEKANAEYLKDNSGELPKIITIELDSEKEYRARATKSNQKQLNYEKLCHKG